MSNFIKKTFHPRKHKWEDAEWIDNFFGNHKYGVIFPSDKQNGKPLKAIAFNPEKIELKTN